MVPPEPDAEPQDMRGTNTRLLRGQDAEIEEVIALTGLWLNPTAFVREAVNEKLERTWRIIETRRGPGNTGERPRGVQDVARRSR